MNSSTGDAASFSSPLVRSIKSDGVLINCIERNPEAVWEGWVLHPDE